MKHADEILNVLETKFCLEKRGKHTFSFKHIKFKHILQFKTLMFLENVTHFK